MRKQIIYTSLLFILMYSITLNAQENKEIDQTPEVSKLFRNQEILNIKLSYLNKDIKKNTNDSTYLETNMSYQTNKGEWKTFKVELRSRGHFRMANCYFPPIKMKIKKKNITGSLFKGNKKLKLVMPCALSNSNNDYIVKEYMAYKLYEEISIYNFKTRLLKISFEEPKNNKTKKFDLKGIFIEDIDKVADRFDGKEVKRDLHPLNQDDYTSIQNALFQFMIGNTDFSTAKRHNIKLIFLNHKTYPVPYDFDMSGLVNTSYANVGAANGETLPISSVTERLYRGFKRDLRLVQKVRSDFLEKKPQFLAVVNELQAHFENPKSYSEAINFIEDFFKIIEDNDRFKSEIIDKLRTK